MKNIISIVALTLCTFCIPAFADSEQRTDLDHELPSGLTVAETLNEWDKSAVRYHMEAPQIKIQKSQSENG